MRYVTSRLGRVSPSPVGLKKPLPSDFCCYCRATRGELEVSI